jgi:hypothetical protein
MHWIIPWNEIARQSYLRALGAGGFDEVLDGIGTGFGLNRLTCFHNTMLGISNADDSNMHADFYGKLALFSLVSAASTPDVSFLLPLNRIKSSKF